MPNAVFRWTSIKRPPILSGQLSHPQEWPLNKGLTVHVAITYLLCMMSVNCEPSSGVWDKLIKSSTCQKRLWSYSVRNCCITSLTIDTSVSFYWNLLLRCTFAWLEVCLLLFLIHQLISIKMSMPYKALLERKELLLLLFKWLNECQLI